MLKREERFALIEKSVLAQAEQKSQELHKQADEYKKREIDNVETKVLNELYAKIQDEIADITNSSSLRISRYENQHHQQLLLRREELTREIFDRVRQRLMDYTATEEYTQKLLATASKLAEEYPQAGGTLSIRSKDAHLLPKLKEILANCEVQTDDSIKIGGMKLMNYNAGFFVDETLDTRLEEQRPWFYSHSGLTIQ